MRLIARIADRAGKRFFVDDRTKVFRVTPLRKSMRFGAKRAKISRVAEAIAENAIAFPAKFSNPETAKYQEAVKAKREAALRLLATPRRSRRRPSASTASDSESCSESRSDSDRSARSVAKGTRAATRDRRRATSDASESVRESRRGKPERGSKEVGKRGGTSASAEVRTSERSSGTSKAGGRGDGRRAGEGRRSASPVGSAATVRAKDGSACAKDDKEKGAAAHPEGSGASR